MLNGGVRPGDVVAIVGAGPIGLSAILGSRLFNPSHIIAIDLADTRLDAAKQFGADIVINNAREDPRQAILDLTDGLGADVSIEAVGVPATFELAATLIRPGGHVANIGVHGEPVILHLEDLWTKNVTITTGLVDTYSTPTLLRLLRGNQIDAGRFVTHHFKLDDVIAAYDTFSGQRRPEPSKSSSPASYGEGCTMWIDRKGSMVVDVPECKRLLAVASNLQLIGRDRDSYRSGSGDHSGELHPMRRSDWSCCGQRLPPRSAADQLVAFEVDHVDVETGWAWSVLVRGLATLSGHLSEGELDSGTRPLVPMPGDQRLTIRTDVLSGRRFEVRSQFA